MDYDEEYDQEEQPYYTERDGHSADSYADEEDDYYPEAS